MKKQYTIPTTINLFIETTSLLQNSLKVNQEQSDYVIENEEDILSRNRNSFWDEEE